MQSSEDFLRGKVAVVTGASKGLGRAMAVSLGGAGVRVVLVARNQAQLAETRSLVEAAGGTAEAFPADITVESSVRALEAHLRDAYGAVHILINNAGVNLRKPVTDFTLDEWNWVLTTNVTSAFLMTAPACRS